MKTLARKTAKSEKTSAPMIMTTKTTKMKANPVSRTAPASHDEIAARSYELYLARGCEAGHAEGDWLEAEAELNSR